MARVIRKTNKTVVQLADSINDLKAFVVAQMRLCKADLSTATGAGTSWAVLGSHSDRSEVTVTAADGTDLASSLTLVNQLRAVYEFHRVDTLAHAAADTANVIAAPIATDLATAITLANELKADYNLHRVQASVHTVNDSTNVVAAADATNLATLQTLINEIKLDLNAHMASGPSAKSVRAVSA